MGGYLVRTDRPDGRPDRLVLVGQPIEVEPRVHADDRRVREVAGRRSRPPGTPRPEPTPTQRTRMTWQISVIGTGYLGAVHAVLGRAWYTVVGVDVDPVKIAALQDGQAPFYEPDLDPLLRKHVDGGDLRFTTEVAEAADADVHFVCVGTPQRHDALAADLKYLDAAIDALAAVLNRPCLVVGKSTVPVGTADRFAAGWLRSLLRVQASSWRGTRSSCEGFAVEDTLRPDRLVFGVRSDRRRTPCALIYAPVIAQGVAVVVTDLPTAELVKASANAFLATKISFINAMAEIWR